MQFLDKRTYLKLYLFRALLLIGGLCLLGALVLQASRYQSTDYRSAMLEEDGAVYKLSAKADANLLDTVTVSNSLSLDRTDWDRTIDLPKFDASLGTLTSAAFVIESELTGSAGYENLEPFPTSVQLTLGAEVTLSLLDSAPIDGAPIISARPQVQIEDESGAFDGGIDFSGLSGRFFTGLRATDLSAPVLFPTADLQDLIGRIGQMDSISLPIRATGASEGSGPANLSTTFSSNVGATVTITYEYEPFTPGIQLEKRINGAIADDPNGADVPQLSAGDAILWEFVVTNDGDSPFWFDDVNVIDAQTVLPIFVSSSDVNADAILSPGEEWLYRAEDVAVNLMTATASTIPGCDFDGTGVTRNAYRNIATVITSRVLATDASYYCNPAPATSTPTPTDTPTDTPTPTDIPTNTPTPTDIPTNTPTPTDIPTNTPTPTDIPTNTPTPTDIPTSTPTPTDIPTNTPMPTDIPTNTPTPTPTPTDIPTNTPTPTDIPTNTPTPTDIPTNTPTDIPTNTPTPTDIPTNTPTPTDIPTNTPTPGIRVEKSADGLAGEEPNGEDVPLFAPGSLIEWHYLVSNTGNVSFAKSEIAVVDDQGVVPMLDASTDLGDDEVLSPGEQWFYRGSDDALALSFDMGLKGIFAGCDPTGSGDVRAALRNIVTVTAERDGLTVEATDRSHYCNPPIPAIDIEKYTNDLDADAPPDPFKQSVLVDDQIRWEYIVRNVGDLSLSDIYVTDDNGTPAHSGDDFQPVYIDGDSNDDGKLNLDEAWRYEMVGTAIIGPYRNLGTATGHYPAAKGLASAGTVVDSDLSHYYGCLAELDFERDDKGSDLQRGQIIDNEWGRYGVRVTTQDPINHPAMIFDTAKPTGKDWDLGTPNIDFGGLGIGAGGASGSDGVNQTALDHVLIISEDNRPSEPDDDAKGGRIIFTFDTPVPIAELTILDVDSDEFGGIVQAFDKNNNLIGMGDLLPLGSNSIQVVSLQAENVSRLEVVFSGSGAITAVTFCR